MMHPVFDQVLFTCIQQIMEIIKHLFFQSTSFLFIICRCGFRFIFKKRKQIKIDISLNNFYFFFFLDADKPWTYHVPFQKGMQQ
jgi:hypothetical protein